MCGHGSLEYKEVLTLYYEAPNRELLDTLYYSQYASDIRLGKEPTDSEELAKEKEAFQQLKEKLQVYKEGLSREK